MLKRKSSFPFFTLLVCSLAIIMIAFIGYLGYNVLADAPEITFRSWSALKPYDGTALTEEHWEMESGELKSGHEVKVEVYGSQTRIGTSKNLFKVRVYDEDGKDVTGQYMIYYIYGFLTVYSPDETAHPVNPPDSSSGGGGGNSGRSINIYATNSGVVYLRHKSYGNFTGVDWNERIPAYGEKDAVNPLTYLSYALKSAGYSEQSMNIKTDMGVTYTPYHFDNQHKLCDADDRLVPYNGSQYTVNYYDQYDVSVLKRLSLAATDLSEQERAYSEYVKENYLSLTANEKGTMLLIAANAGISADDDDVIEKVANYIQSAATYNLSYQPYPDDVNHAIYFLLQAKEGVCVQYATSATLMYRALGIPARYVTGYMGHTKEDEWVRIDASVGHAWVEVYIDGLGWIPVEVTPPSGSGDGQQGSNDNEIPPEDKPLGVLELTPVYVSGKYTGRPLYAKNKLTGFEEWEEYGYTYNTKVTGLQVDYGYGISTIQQVILRDPDGNDITDQFSLVLNTGKIHVYYSNVVSMSRDQIIAYTGRDDYVPDVARNASDLMKGHTMKVHNTAPSYVGKFANSYVITVHDEKGEDVSYFYEFSNTFGTLTIKPHALTITPVSATKVYDGTPLVSQEYTTKGELLDGHSIASYTISGSQTEVGRSDCIMTDIVIKDKKGNDVTSNYAITFGVGVLEITAG